MDENRPFRHLKMPGMIALIILVGLAINWKYAVQYFDAVIGAIRPFLVAAFIALILNAPMTGLENCFDRSKLTRNWPDKTKKGIAFALVLVFTLIVAFVIFRFVIPQLTRMLTILVEYLKTHSDILGQIQQSLKIESQVFDDALQDLLKRISALIVEQAQNIIASLLRITTSTLVFLLSVTLAFYLLSARNTLRKQFARAARAFLPEPKAKSVITTNRLVVRTISTWFGHQCIEACILGGMLFIVMTVFGMPYAVPQSFLTAFMQMIPYVGAWISFAVGFVTMLSVDLHTAILFGVLLLTLQQIEGYLIYPHVVGKSVGLPPWLSLTAVCAGGALLGMGGMLISVPLTSVVYTLFREFVRSREMKKENQIDLQDAQEAGEK